MMLWLEADTLIVISAVACALACAIPGTLLVLRQMSMMGDAISHTVLPGIAIAFLVTGSREPMPMFIGAAIIGILTAVFVQWVRDLGKTDGGTAMGIVFTTLFAVGLILIRQATDSVDLDPSCVLYGAIETAALDTITIVGLDIPRPALVNGVMFVVNLVLFVLFYKEFKISSFDPALATTLGFNAKVLHYLLMVMTAATAVAAFESVGTILVIAMLIVPPATAFLLTDRFVLMFVFAGIIGMISAAVGHISAITVPHWFGAGDTVTAGMMAFVSGLLLLLAWLFAPRHGMLARFLSRWRLGLRMLGEDVLGILYRAEEMQQRHPPDGDEDAFRIGIDRLKKVLLAPAWQIRLAGIALRRTEQVTKSRDGRFHLTELGRRHARRLVRTHRLWETYLVEVLDLRPDHTHRTAHGLEHLTDLSDRLDARLGQPVVDPHGKAIPDDPDATN